LVEEQAVPAGKVDFKVFEGSYTITREDVAGASLQAHFTLYEDHKINVYVDYFDLKVLCDETGGPRELKVDSVESGLRLTWSETRLQRLSQ